MSVRRSYWTRLADHNGLTMTLVMTVYVGANILLDNNFSLWGGVMLGVICVSPFWAIVLWTNRYQP